MEKIRVGAVSYLNTKPLLYGIERLPVKEMIELVTDHPSNIANRLLNDSIDVGLVPVAVIPEMSRSYIVSDYCIGANGPVASVALFSDVPLEQIEQVLLDYQSRTSVNLARLLLARHWKKKVAFIDTANGFQNEISGSTAGVVIGDRAFIQRKHSRYIYDLGETWKRYSGLPFVFAAWIANKPLPEDFIAAFNEANQYGLDHLPQVIAENPYPAYDLKTYFTGNISYRLDAQKKAGLDRFLYELGTLRETA